jgi:hypothetical protein
MGGSTAPRCSAIHTRFQRARRSGRTEAGVEVRGSVGSSVPPMASSRISRTPRPVGQDSHTGLVVDGEAAALTAAAKPADQRRTAARASGTREGLLGL